MIGIKDLDEEFQEGLRGLKDKDMGLIPRGLYFGEIMSLRRSLRRGYKTEVLNRGWDAVVIEEKKLWKKRE